MIGIHPERKRVIEGSLGLDYMGCAKTCMPGNLVSELRVLFASLNRENKLEM